MGYSTDFYGGVVITPKLTPAQMAYINAFSDARHMRRDVEQLVDRLDPVRFAAKLPLGKEGEYFIGVRPETKDPHNFMNDAESDTVIDVNRPPDSQPGLWCQWVVRAPEEDENATANQTILEWNGAEKFYDYIEWLEYLVERFFIPWGATLSGEIEWQGEERDDFGIIIVDDNKVTTKQGRRIYR